MSLPYFPMYPTDFEADTSHLTLAEDGAYNRLLRLMWMTSNCSLPDDNAWIKRRMRVDQETFDSVVLVVIAEFFKRKGGRIISPRLAREYHKTDLAHKKRVAAGSKGGKAKAAGSLDKDPSKAKAMPKQPEPEPEPYKVDTNVSLRIVVSKPELFEDFWNQYPHRNGAKKGKAKAGESYARQIKAGSSEQEIIGGAMRYASDRQVVEGYAKDPTTWLNSKGWQDDIEPVNTPAQGNENNNHNGRGRPGSGTVDAFAATAIKLQREQERGGEDPTDSPLPF